LRLQGEQRGRGMKIHGFSCRVKENNSLNFVVGGIELSLLCISKQIFILPLCFVAIHTIKSALSQLFLWNIDTTFVLYMVELFCKGAIIVLPQNWLARSSS
jgi:hypothetical protein